jgi:large subunit ribosomal protein L24
MKIKRDDNVIVISGKDRGKTGKVLKAFPREGKIVMAGVNVVKVHERARKQGGKGQVVEKSMPFPVSNVMIADPKTGARTRVGMKKEGDKKVRTAKKSGQTLA